LLKLDYRYRAYVPEAVDLIQTFSVLPCVLSHKESIASKEVLLNLERRVLIGLFSYSSGIQQQRYT
jgi:hypothetical protein